MQLNPYLNFNGNAEDAFSILPIRFWWRAFLKRMNEVPEMENLPEEEKNCVLHISLLMSNGQTLIFSDTLLWGID